MNKRIIKTVVMLTVISVVLGVTGGLALAKDEWFKDVSKKHWGYEAIKWAKDNNIVGGYDDGTFKPNKEVTESEFLSILFKTYGMDVEPKEGEHWTEPLYLICNKMNYHTIGETDKYGRSNEINRTQVAVIIAGTQGYNYFGNDAIQYLLDSGLSEGKESATIEGYHGKDYLTRAEAVQFIKNVLDKGESKELLVSPKENSNKDAAFNYYTFDMKVYLDRLIESLDDKNIDYSYSGQIKSPGTNGNMYDITNINKEVGYTNIDWDNAVAYRVYIQYYSSIYKKYVYASLINYDSTGQHNSVYISVDGLQSDNSDIAEITKSCVEAMGLVLPTNYIEVLDEVKEGEVVIMNWGGIEFSYKYEGIISLMDESRYDMYRK